MLHRWRERDDQWLVKQPGPSADTDPLKELIHVVNEAQIDNFAFSGGNPRRSSEWE
jgi:hypothetical protein